MITGHGVKSPSMARYGIRARWMLVGLPIATDIGTGLGRGAGHGWIMRPGALRHITMDGGRMSAERGAGALVRSTRVRSMDRRLLDLSGEHTSVSDSDLAGAGAAELAGSRWVSTNRIIRGIARAEITTAT